MSHRNNILKLDAIDATRPRDTSRDAVDTSRDAVAATPLLVVIVCTLLPGV